MDFVRSKRPDPQGWRLARHSSTFSQWARNVAQEKGLKYCCEVEQGSNMDDKLKQSQDELDSNALALRGTTSFSDDGAGRTQSDMHSIEKEEVRKKYGEDVVNAISKGQERYDATLKSVAVQTSPTDVEEIGTQSSVELSVETSLGLLQVDKSDDGEESKREDVQSPCQKTGEE